MPHFRMHYMHGFSFLLLTLVLIFDCHSIAPRSILLVLHNGMLSAEHLFVLPSEMGCLRWGVFSESDADGSINREHLDAYVHDASKWKIG